MQDSTQVMAQGSVSVCPEHRHLFKKSLAERLTGLILEKQNWLDFVDMAQQKCASSRHQELKWCFQAWARPGLAQNSLSQPPNRRHKFTKGSKATKQTQSELAQSCTSGHAKRHKMDFTADNS
jgi:hypothetical protein